MGIVSFREAGKVHIPYGKPEDGIFFTGKRITGHASQTFRWEVLKNRYEKNPGLWERGIAPPQLLHRSAAAFRTDSQINVPYCFEQLCHR